MVSPTLLINSSTEHVSSQSILYQPSICSTHSRSHLFPRDIRDSSLEHLIRPVSNAIRVESKHLGIGRGYKRRMASNGSEGAPIERKKSYGIGGAGNIRMPGISTEGLLGADANIGRPSEVVYAPRTNPDGTRRTSVWSNMSSAPPDGRRASIMSLFRRGSVANETRGGSGSGGSEVFDGSDLSDHRKTKS